jgi:hypothetical protein
MMLFGIAGVQMNVSAFQDNLERISGYLRHIGARFPWVREQEAPVAAVL